MNEIISSKLKLTSDIEDLVFKFEKENPDLLVENIEIKRGGCYLQGILVVNIKVTVK